MKVRVTGIGTVAIIDTVKHRVINYDSAELRNRLALDAYKRANRLTTEKAFPTNKGLCACGCGVALTGKQRRWHSKECNDFAYLVTYVFAGSRDVIYGLLEYRDGDGCKCCGVSDEPLEVDHVLPVHQGGGGCWLDNFQLLCVDCHKEKTRQQRG